LSVSGLDVWRNSVALTYTQGRSGDCCENHRRGHIVVLDVHGSPMWRSVVPIDGAQVEEVITNDVTVTRGLLIVSGAVIRKATAEDAYLVAMSVPTGSVLWRHVTDGRTELNVDEYQQLDAVRGAVFVNGRLDDAFEGGGGTYVLERWRIAGKRAWRVHSPSYASVSALRNRSVIWSAVDYYRAHEPLIVGKQRPGGERAWREISPLVDDPDYPVGYTFAASRHRGVGAADILRPRADVLQVWGWRLR
jgi:hypothetical protein